MARQPEELLRTFDTQGRLDIAPSPVRAIGMTVVSILIALIGVVVVLVAQTIKGKLIGGLMVAFGGLGTWASIMRIVGRGTHIVLDRQGIANQGVALVWADVTGVGIQEYSGQKFVIVTPSEAGAQRLKSTGGSLVLTNLANTGGVSLSNQMKESPETIATVVEAVWRRHATGSATTS